MKVALSCNNYVSHKNRMFSGGIEWRGSEPPLGDDIWEHMRFLKRYLEERGHKVCAVDEPGPRPDAMVFYDYPYPWDLRFLRGDGVERFLIAHEPPVARPPNYDARNHDRFRKVFTWKKSLLDSGQPRYVKMLCPRLPAFEPNPAHFDPSTKSEFCITILSYKREVGPGSLYDERLRCIRWFEENHLDQFQLYGGGWDKPFFGGRWSVLNRGLRTLYRHTPVGRWISSPRRFPSWRGAVPRKNEVLAKFRFAICYENFAEDNWITEKIFDALWAGCIPIYIGASNIRDYVPGAAFIDRNEFADYEALHRRMVSMTESEHRGYLKAIWDYIHSDQPAPFSIKRFAEIILEHVAR